MQIEWSLPKKIKACIKLLLAGRTPKLSLSERSKILLVGIPIHDNLGDHLLAEAGVRLLADIAPDRTVHDISTEEYMLNRRSIIESLNPADYVFVAGGGWMGDSWPNDEMMIRDIVESLSPICTVIILPQTIHYQSRGGLFESGCQFWGAVSNTYVCARENQSYQVAIEELGISSDHCLLLPDIGLLYEPENQRGVARKGALVCLRSDREALTSKRDRDQYIRLLESRFGVVNSISTLTKRVVSPQRRNKIINAKIAQFGAAEIVVTDRLHGMIFSVLAGTPCIALNNITGKVFGVKEKWLSGYPGVVIANDAQNVESLLTNLDAVFPSNYVLALARESLAKNLFRYCSSKIKELINE